MKASEKSLKIIKKLMRPIICSVVGDEGESLK